MKALIFIFIKAPRKIFRIISDRFEYCHYRFFYSERKIETDLTQKRYLVCGGENLADIANIYRELFPDRVEAKISEADLICEHVFELLGSGPKELSQERDGYRPIDWHSDFKSGYRWNPKTFYRYIRYGHINGVDVIVPWELSRAQHLISLGQAFLLSGSKKYAEEFKNQINDWIDHNKVGFGVNWYTAMDSAIRAANWLAALEFFTVDKDLLDKKFLNKLYTAIYQHGCYIRRHLQRINNITTNHYVAGITGLLFISLCCPFLEESKKWQKFAIEELEKEIEKQVHSDGCDYEASTSYHLLVLEIFFYALLLCERAGISLSESYRSKVKKMFDVSLYYLKPNGMAPQVGDNDNGRFFKFTKRQILDHRYLLTLADVYYKDSDFKLKYSEFSEEAFWLFGHDRKIIWDKLPRRTSALTSKSFPEAGWFIIRHNNDYCFISCGANGQGGNGGHAHNDKLSFELMLDVKDVIVDPGTYTYTAYPKERNKFRSTEYHNTITFNGCEQNKVSANAIFGLPDRVKITNAVLTETDDNITFQGEIRYLDLTHKRVISLDKETCNWQITDRISCRKAVDAKLTFHLSPDVFFDNGFIFSKRTKKTIASIEIPGHILEKSEYDYSPEYGVKMKADYIAANVSVMEKTQTIDTYIKRVQ